MAPGLEVTLPHPAWPTRGGGRRETLLRAAALAGILVVAALISTSESWQPASLVAALTGLMVAADALPVPARLIRLTPGLMIQVVIMALLGPAPAVVIGVASTVVESRVNRVAPRRSEEHTSELQSRPYLVCRLL